jgi:hypothetical protein
MEVPEDIREKATRFAGEYLAHDVSCERLYRDVVALLIAERERCATIAEGLDRPAGHYRVRGPTPNGGNPADGMTIDVSFGDGAVGSIVNPTADPHPEWVARYGSAQSINFALAGFLETYDYLLSDHINDKEAVRRLRIMRAVRRDAIRI